MAKLIEAQRHEIARRWVGGEAAGMLAAEFGISTEYVYTIARRRGKRRSRSKSGAPASRAWRTWSQKLQRLRACGKLTEFVFKASELNRVAKSSP